MNQAAFSLSSWHLGDNYDIHRSQRNYDLAKKVARSYAAQAPEPKKIEMLPHFKKQEKTRMADLYREKKNQMQQPRRLQGGAGGHAHTSEGQGVPTPQNNAGFFDINAQQQASSATRTGEQILIKTVKGKGPRADSKPRNSLAAELNIKEANDAAAVVAEVGRTSAQAGRGDHEGRRARFQFGNSAKKQSSGNVN